MFYSLSELVEIDSGYAFKSNLFTSEVNNGLPIIRIRDVNAGFSNTYFQGEYDKKYIVNNGDLLITMDGEFTIKEWNDGKALLNQRVCRIKSTSKLLHSKYLLYIMPKILKEIEDKTPYVTVKHLSIKRIKKAQINLPSYEQQLKIIKALDLVVDIISYRNQQIIALSDLKQSIFYDMFGDPDDYNNKIKRVKIKDLFEVQTGTTPSRKQEKYWKDGKIPWIKTTHLKDSVITNTDEYITEVAIQESNLKVFPGNTVLIAMYGQGKTRGKTGILNFPATTNQACAALLPNNKINTTFIWQQLILRYETLRNLGRGGNQPNLNLTLIKEFDLLFPDIDKQNEYSEVVNKIEQQEQNIQISLKEMRTLYNSLMQKAFKGELFQN